MDNSDLETSSAKTNEIKLVGWGHYDFDAERRAAKENRPHNQKDYFTELRECENMAEIIARIEELVISEIVKNGFRFDGDSHQKTSSTQLSKRMSTCSADCRKTEQRLMRRRRKNVLWKSGWN